MEDLEYYSFTRRDEVVDYYAKNLKNTKCGLCGEPELLILGDDHSLVVTNHDISVINPKDGNSEGIFTAYVVMCENCGSQTFINVKKLEQIMNKAKDNKRSADCEDL